MIAYLALYLIVLAAGFSVVRRQYPFLPAWSAVVLGFPVGVAIQALGANLASHVCGYDLGIWLATAATTGLALLSWAVPAKRQDTIQEGEPAMPGMTLGQAGLLLVLLALEALLLNLDNGIFLIHDANTHGAVFSQYHYHRLSYPVDVIYSSNVSVPVPLPEPSRLLYHFGHDLFHATLVSLSDAPPHWAYWLTSALSITALVAVVFVMVYHSTGSYWLALASLLPLPFSAYRFPWTMKTANAVLFPAHGTYVIFSILLGLVVIYLACLPIRRGGMWPRVLLTATLLAALEIINESMLVIVAPVAFLTLVVLQPRLLPALLSGGLLALVPIYLAGGVLGGIMRGDSIFTFNYPIGRQVIRLRTHDFLHIDPFYGQAFPVYAPQYLTANLELVLALVAFTCLVAWCRWRRAEVPMVIWQFFGVTALGYLVPGSLDFGYPQNVDAIRYVNQTSWAPGLLGVAAACWLLRSCLGDRLTAIKWAWPASALALGLVFAFSYPSSAQTAARLFKGDWPQRAKAMAITIEPRKLLEGCSSPYLEDWRVQASFRAMKEFSGVKPSSLNTTADEYHKLMDQAKARQDSRRLKLFRP